MKSTILAILVLPLAAAGVIAADLPRPTRAFIDSYCVDCHDAANKKGGLDLNALSTNLDDLPTEAKWTLVYDRVRRGEMPPKKERVKDGETEGFMRSLGGFLSEHDAARHAKTGRVAWRRLNRVEYEKTVHDLLAVDVSLAPLLPEDGSAYGFDNVSEALRLSPTQIEGYLTAADVALNAAITYRPRPEVKSKKLSGLDLAGVKRHLSRPSGSLHKDGSKFMQYFRALPDAAVVFENGLWDLIVDETRAEYPGMYRVRVSAYSHQSQDRPTVVFKLMTSDHIRTRFIAAFDLVPDQPRVFEYTMRMEKEQIWLNSSGCNFTPDGKYVQNIGGEKYPGTGMAIQWLEFEGPLLESWPPPSMQRVFGHVQVKLVEKPKNRDVAYEVVSANPADDAAALITRFAERAFRRPVAAEDAAPYIVLARQVLEKGGTLEAALRRAYKAILVSPKFLFLQEESGRLNDYALASRLSYFLWSTMPDEELVKLAAAGTLHEPAILRAQTERMLANPKAKAFTRNFCGQWLNLRAIDATTPDGQLYPEFDGILRDAMIAETEGFFEEMLHENLGVTTLVQSDFAMLNRRLAEHYGIPGVVGEQIRKVKLPPGSHRGGLLTQASILKVTANGTLSSPVVRGAWVMKRLLGRDTQPPPADAGSIEPDTRGATTIREQLDRHRNSTRCMGCHKYMDPYGFALESFDVIGGWRENYRSKDKGKTVIDPVTKRGKPYRQGLPVDPSGQLVDGRTFANIDALKEILRGQSEAIAENLVNNLVAYATGAGVTFADREGVQAILRRTKPDSYGLRSLIHAVVQSPLFLSK